MAQSKQEKKMGDAIRFVREACELTQEELAHKVGAWTWVVRLWERDKLWPDARQFGALIELVDSTYPHIALLKAAGINVPRLAYYLHSQARHYNSPLTGRPLQCTNPDFWHRYFDEMTDAGLVAQWATTDQEGLDDHAN